MNPQKAQHMTFYCMFFLNIVAQNDPIVLIFSINSLQ